MSFTAGDRVVVRRQRWVVEQVTTFGDATLLDLSNADDDARGRRCRLLAPFDRPVAIDPSLRIRATTRRCWMHRLHRHRSQLCRSGDLRAAAGAAIDVLPFQLEPALALIRGHGSRVLLADEVGLGKTIQAGLMLAELRHRGFCEHALIITPAGLRQQWADELQHRFHLAATIVDAASLAALTSTLPFDVNPWDVEPISITSVDFLKQPEVLHGVGRRLWDVVIVDEAHQAATASLRYEAVDAVAKRARHVILLTATPHAGDDRAYRALCAVGDIGESNRIILFRRTRERIGNRTSRRVHLLPVAQTHDGAALHHLLNSYVARLWTIARESGRHDVRLVAMVLAKRAFSCAKSLTATLERRLAALAGDVPEPAQSCLPFGIDEESDDAWIPVAPAFERPAEERELLERLIDAAHRAQAGDRKLHVLTRIIRRVREPLIIFTEYRDTLDAIRDAIADLRTITTLHGGQSPHERTHAVRTFTAGAADILLATDAGSEGLNLQTTCRLVVNLELPWNPTRLEQRIGRVDRIGQTRTVHAINLFAAGTAEQTVLASLLRRIDRIRMSEIETAACVIGHAAPPPQCAPAEASTTRTVSLERESRAAAEHVIHARILSAHQSNVPEGVVPVTASTTRQTALIFFFRIRIATRSGRLLEDRLVPIRLPLAAAVRHLGRKDVRALAESLVERCGAIVLSKAKAHAQELARIAAHQAALSVATALHREHALLNDVMSDGASLVQAGLFDNRALKEKHAEEERSKAMRLESDTRSRALDADATPACAADPELVMLLFL